ncbi:hypothetical protein GLW05_20960 [Pontibacillus yanchengensis]|uniref:Uncharacterized protein n=1 Tax=Pontibacillus yanchengensis TaxID=462910 RepID=A0A6I5A6L8_9BACI|nr:DUF3408 domain-containing protein [Pontibacillus yanchengensis]MYL36045.1 hypothetical protein [Pontibacillus yanchengensis]
MSFEEQMKKSKENKNTPKKAIDTLMPQEQETPTTNKQETNNDFLSIRREKTIDTHTRHTFLIRKDLLERLNKLSEVEGRGFMKDFIDNATLDFLQKYEDEILNRNK